MRKVSKDIKGTRKKHEGKGLRICSKTGKTERGMTITSKEGNRKIGKNEPLRLHKIG